MSKRCSPPSRPAQQPTPTLNPTLIGIDVAKDELVIAQLHSSSVQAIANSPAAIQAWLAGIARPACVALESTGRYSHLVCQLAHQAGLLVYLLNALDVHHYAKAIGHRGKTDRLDAQVIAQYLHHRQSQLRPWQPTPALLGQIRSLIRCRAQIVKAAVQLKLSLQDTPQLQSQAKALAAQFKQATHSIDEQLQAMLHSDPQLSQGAARLQSIQGVGPLGATLLATLLARIPFQTAGALVAYSGLDPRAADSGKKQGVRRLSKRGDPQLRRQMWLCAMAASRCSSFRAQYEALKARGLATTAAYVVIARKLLRIAFAVWHGQQLFDPQKVVKLLPSV
jgi:transposase